MSTEIEGEAAEENITAAIRQLYYQWAKERQTGGGSLLYSSEPPFESFEKFWEQYRRELEICSQIGERYPNGGWRRVLSHLQFPAIELWEHLTAKWSENE